MGAGENLECRYVVSFLKEHGREVYTEVRAAYIDTMNKVIFFRTYHVFVIDFSMTETFRLFLLSRLVGSPTLSYVNFIMDPCLLFFVNFSFLFTLDYY